MRIARYFADNKELCLFQPWGTDDVYWRMYSDSDQSSCTDPANKRRSRLSFMATKPETDLVGPLERLAHIEQMLPEICTLDCGSLNFGEGSLIYVSTPDMLRAGAKRIQELGVKPELEIFDTGQLWFVNKLIEEGLIDNPALIQLCLGVAWGSPCDTGSMKNMVEHLPAGANWASFGLGADQMPMVAQAALLGGHVRVGLEDNLYLERGVLASNAQLVEKARQILELMGARTLSPAEARVKLAL